MEQYETLYHHVSNNTCTIPVSYTHLDVYKRQVLYSAHRDFARGFGQISSYNIAIFYRRFLVIVRSGAAGLPLRRTLLLHSLSAFIIVIPYGVIKGIPPSMIRRLTDPYPFSCLPISSQIRRLTVIFARLPHPQIIVAAPYPFSYIPISSQIRLLGACFRLLGRGEAVRRESRQPAEVTDGGGASLPPRRWSLPG